MGTEIGSSKFRQLEQKAFGSDGKIDAKKATELGKAAKKEDKAVAEQVLYDDAFEDTAARKAYARAAGLNSSDVKKSKANDIAGQMVGSASVLKTLGDPKGYENPLEAISSARQSGVSNAAIVKEGGRYYAVQLSKEQTGELATGSGSITGAVGLKNYDQGTVDQLRKDLQQARADGDASKMSDLQQQLAGAIYGLPKDAFNIIGKDSGRKATTFDAAGMPSNINIQNGLYNEGTGGTEGTHSPAGVGSEGFDPANATAVTIDAGELEGRTKNDGTFDLPSTDSATGVLHHEGTHLEDHAEAKKWVDKWQQATGGTWVQGGQNVDFQAWMTKQLEAHEKNPKKGVDEATYARVTRTVSQLNNDTEAHAHIASAVDAIRNGAPEVAKEQLVDYASVSAKNKAQPSTSELNQLLNEATAAYKTMTKQQQKEFKAAIKAANAIEGSPLKGYDPDKYKLRK